MLTYNRPQFIGRAVESVHNQSYQDWELLVVQDGHNQHTKDIMREWTARDPRIRHLCRDKGGNIADATNYGLAAAHGEYIAILDDDDIWADPDKLQEQIDFLDQHPDHLGCGGGAIVVDEQDRERLRYLKPEKAEAINRVILQANPMIHSTGVYRRQAVLEVGGYDVSLPGYQDWDVWLKLCKRGKLHNFPKYYVYYRIWDGGGTFISQRRNASSALRIVLRHWRHHRRACLSLALVVMYNLYAHLPVWVRRPTHSYLSRMKKGLFSR